MLNKRYLRKVLSVAAITALSLGVSSCSMIPKPFEQNVPQTTWTVDENGNKVKVESGSKKLTYPQQVAKAGEDFYASIMSDKNLEKMMRQEASTFKKLEGKYDVNTPKGLEAYQHEIAKLTMKYDPAFMSQISFDDVTEKQKLDVIYKSVETYFIFFLFGALSADTEIKIEVPVQAVRIKGDTATIDNSKTKVTLTEGGKLVEGGSGSDPNGGYTSMVKSNDRWMIDGKAFAAEIEADKTAKK